MKKLERLLWWALAILVVYTAYQMGARGDVPTPVAEPPEPNPFCFIVPRPGLAARCVVTRVVDGDTIEVELKLATRVRLLDCWAPERGEFGGPESAENLRTLAQDKPGVLWVPFDGRRLGDAFTFGRVLGHVQLNGEIETLSEQQVRAGFATFEK